MAAQLRRRQQSVGELQACETCAARQASHAGEETVAQEKFDAVRMREQMGAAGASALGGTRGVRVVAGAAELTGLGLTGALWLNGTLDSGGEFERRGSGGGAYPAV